MQISSKLPKSETTIFTVMSALSREHDAINLGQGFPDFDCDPRLRDEVAKQLNSSKNQYCPMPGLLALRQTLSEKIRGSYGVEINAESEICITAGATQGIFTAITAFIHRGDEVIIIEPAYDSYQPSILLAGGKPIIYTMESPDYTVDWNQLTELITERTRMIIVNTPHNPTGTILQDADMKSLESLVLGKNIIVLSDEVYEHLIYDGEEHRSVLRYPALARQSIAVYSFGKTLHSTGWKMGYCVGPAALIQEFKNVHQWNVFCVNSFIQYGLANYLKDPSTYTDLSEFYGEKRDFLTNALQSSALVPKSSKGTFFQLYDYSEVSDMDDVSFAKHLTTQHGVAVIPLSPFYSEAPGDKIIRLCFAKKKETLEKAALRLNNLR